MEPSQWPSPKMVLGLRALELVDRMSRVAEPRDDNDDNAETLASLLEEARSIVGDNRDDLPCEPCDGAGYVYIPNTAGKTADCEPCGGTGRVPNEVTA